MNTGNWLRLALVRFDARVLECMVEHSALPLGLSNLAARGQVGAAHIHITRHLPLEGARLVDLARSAGMTKQAMGVLVNQCAAWGMVERILAPRDARARIIRFTEIGLAWMNAYRDAVQQTEAELRQAVGEDVATVISIGLEAYASH